MPSSIFSETSVAWTRARAAADAGDWLESVGHVDVLADSEEPDPEALLVRAVLRELVGDFAGGLADLDRLSAPTDSARVVRARLLARTGFMDHAAEEVVRLSTAKGSLEHDERGVPWLLGIGGRRVDLGIADAHAEREPSNQALGGTRVENRFVLGDFAGALDLLDGPYRAERWSEGARILVEWSSRHDRLERLGPSEALAKLLPGTRGWLSLDEAGALERLAAQVPPSQAIVELGSFYGRSATALSLGARAGSDAACHLVDPHCGLEGYGADRSLAGLRAQLERIESSAHVHVTTSTALGASWRGPRVGLLFVDAVHEEDAVRADLDAWRPHLAAGARIAFHDANQPGPNAVIREEVAADRLRPLGFRDSLFVTENAPPLRDESLGWTRLLEHELGLFEGWIQIDRARVEAQARALLAENS